MVTALGDRRVEFDLAQERHTQFFTQCTTTALTEEGVTLAAGAGETAHVLDDAEDADVRLAREVRGASGDALCGDRRCRHDQLAHLRKESRECHRDVAGPRRRVDQEVVDTRPVGVLDELGDGLLHHQSAPHECLVLVGQESHRQQLDRTRTDATFERLHLPPVASTSPNTE